MMPIRESAGRAVLTLACLVAGPLMAADPFYSSLLERGLRDLERGSANEAIVKLRTACFGFLDEPVLLAEGLVQLGRAQAATGSRVGLRRTLDRLVEIESRFGAYSALENPALQTRFEAVVRTVLGASEADASQLFPPPGKGSETATPPALAPKTPRQQRKALAARLKQNPDDLGALYELAQLQYRAGKNTAAALLLDRLLTVAPEDEAGICLRTKVAVARRDCAPAIALADHCPAATASDDALGFVLDCLIASGNSAEATQLLNREPPQRRESPVIAAIAQRLDAAGTDPVSAQGPVAPAIEITVGLDERIRRLRSAASNKRFREQLAQSLAAAFELAAENPDSPAAQHLVAEIAYRGANHALAADYFERGGEPGESQPELSFYMAVSLFETGNRERARAVLSRALPALEQSGVSEHVQSYIERIQETP